MWFHSPFLIDSLLDSLEQVVPSALVGVAAGGDEESEVEESGKG